MLTFKNIILFFNFIIRFPFYSDLLFMVAYYLIFVHNPQTKVIVP